MNPEKGEDMLARWGITGTIVTLGILLIFVTDGMCEKWVHRDVWLKNEQGELITGTENSSDPYSPRQTCGRCHPYSTITSGFHFQQGFDEMSDTYDPRRPWIYSPGMFGKW